MAAAMARFVSAGGGLFISVGDRVDTTMWNERMAKLWPQPLGLPRTASALPGQHAGEIVDDRPAERLAPIDRRHPLLASFPEHGEGLVSARFFKYMLLDPAPESPERGVILRYESSAPALVEKQVGKGRVMLLSTTVDREWTDLPIRTGFLPLVREASPRAGEAREHGASHIFGSAARLRSQAREDRDGKGVRHSRAGRSGDDHRSSSNRRGSHQQQETTRATPQSTPCLWHSRRRGTAVRIGEPHAASSPSNCSRTKCPPQHIGGGGANRLPP